MRKGFKKFFFLQGEKSTGRRGKRHPPPLERAGFPRTDTESSQRVALSPGAFGAPSRMSVRGTFSWKRGENGFGAGIPEKPEGYPFAGGLKGERAFLRNGMAANDAPARPRKGKRKKRPGNGSRREEGPDMENAGALEEWPQKRLGKNSSRSGPPWTEGAGNALFLRAGQHKHGAAGVRARYAYGRASYSLSDTSSCHSLRVSSPGTSTATWANQLSFAAPCQCFTPAGMMTTSPGCSSRAGLPHA